MKNVEIGGRKEIKTPSHVLLAKVLDLQLEGLAQEHGHLQGEGLEPAQDTMCQYP